MTGATSHAENLRSDPRLPAVPAATGLRLEYFREKPSSLLENRRNFVLMDTANKPAWENLSEDHRSAWIQQVINFYPPNTSSPQELVELARDEYNDAESLLPLTATCEVE